MYPKPEYTLNGSFVSTFHLLPDYPQIAHFATFFPTFSGRVESLENVGQKGLQFTRYYTKEKMDYLLSNRKVSPLSPLFRKPYNSFSLCTSSFNKDFSAM